MYVKTNFHHVTAVCVFARGSKSKSSPVINEVCMQVSRQARFRICDMFEEYAFMNACDQGAWLLDYIQNCAFYTFYTQLQIAYYVCIKNTLALPLLCLILYWVVLAFCIINVVYTKMHCAVYK